MMEYRITSPVVESEGIETVKSTTRTCTDEASSSASPAPQSEIRAQDRLKHYGGRLPSKALTEI